MIHVCINLASAPRRDEAPPFVSNNNDCPLFGVLPTRFSFVMIRGTGRPLRQTESPGCNIQSLRTQFGIQFPVGILGA